MSIVPLGQQNIQANENVFLKTVEKHSSGSHESFKRFSKHWIKVKPRHSLGLSSFPVRDSETRLPAESGWMGSKHGKVLSDDVKFTTLMSHK